MVTQRLNPRNLEFEEEKKEQTGIGLEPSNLPGAEVTQNLSMPQNFQPEMTANFVPSELAGAIERNLDRNA